MSQFGPSATILTVRLFAIAADAVGNDRVKVAFAENESLSQFAIRVGVQFPSLERIIAISRWAVNQKFAVSSHIIQRDDEIALIPPVSGG